MQLPPRTGSDNRRAIRIPTLTVVLDSDKKKVREHILGGVVIGLILALVGAVIGSILFTKLVKVALAFLVGLLAAAVVYGLLGGQARFTEGSLDVALVGALLVLIVVFAISYYFIDDIIGIITAAIGGLLLALGLYLLSAGVATAGLAGLGVFILGALVPTAPVKQEKRARARAAAHPPPPPPPPPPALENCASLA